MKLVGSVLPYHLNLMYQNGIILAFEVSRMAINKGFKPLLYYSHSIPGRISMHLKHSFGPFYYRLFNRISLGILSLKNYSTLLVRSEE